MSNAPLYTFKPLKTSTLSDGLFRDRFKLNRAYLISLSSDALLQNHYQEAGITKQMFGTDTNAGWHWGWETPTCQLRGHFLGHWLSAAAKSLAIQADPELRAKADTIVQELKRCQEHNGGQWCASIPIKYLQWISGELPKQPVWAPHYTIHKTLMGLLDMYTYAASEIALTVLENFAGWFHEWSMSFSREQMDDILDVETGGMLEIWASLYGITGRQEHKDLMERYDRPRLFDPLVAGIDMLTNMHANTTIPEALGAVRAYEVTGDIRWRQIAEAYWRCAVTERGTYCTGGQTSGEIWTPPFEFAARRGDKNQEHCTVYNMIRLADALLHWTGDAVYADFIERNLYNGILAQQHSQTGMVSYFLPLQAGAKKRWGSATGDFWCCHGTLVQAQASHGEWIWQADESGPVLSQYIPSTTDWTAPDGAQVSLELSTIANGGSSMDNAAAAGARHRPMAWTYTLRVRCDKPSAFSMKLRIPEWIAGEARISVNDAALAIDTPPGSYLSLNREWTDNTVQIHLPTSLRTASIPDEPDVVAFLNGPIVLAGLSADEQTLVGDISRPETLLVPDNERQWSEWLQGFRTRGQQKNIRFLPVHTITDDAFTLYFPTKLP